MNNQVLDPDMTDDTIRRLQEENAALRRRIAELEQVHAAEQDQARRQEIHEVQEHARQGYELLSHMGHDVRTPMGGLLGYISLLLDEEMTEAMTAAEQREHIKRIEACSRVLLDLLNDIFDFAKIRAGRVEVVQEPFDLRDSIGETLSFLAYNASNEGIRLVSAIDNRLPVQLLGDVPRLRQILMNLVDHLILNSKIRREYKGLDGQTVLVTVEQSPPAEEKTTAYIHITISNTCTDILEREHKSIETIAAPSSHIRLSHWHHSKLGLPISYHFVEMMDGTLSIEEDDNRICTFNLVLPFKYSVTPR